MTDDPDKPAAYWLCSRVFDGPARSAAAGMRDCEKCNSPCWVDLRQFATAPPGTTLICNQCFEEDTGESVEQSQKRSAEKGRDALGRKFFRTPDPPAG